MAQIKSFHCYARKVSRQIDDRRTRKDTYQEIYAHLIESKENFLKTGMSEEEAQRTALLQMGDATDIGGELDRIHTPKLKLWHILVIGLILVLIVASIYGYFYWQLGVIEKEIKIKNSANIRGYFIGAIRTLERRI
jgi:hypothetical protein